MDPTQLGTADFAQAARALLPPGDPDRISDPNAAANIVRNDQERLAQDLLRNLKSPVR